MDETQEEMIEREERQIQDTLTKSWLGVASGVIGILALLSLCLMIGFSMMIGFQAASEGAYYVPSDPYEMLADYPYLVVASLCMLGSCGLSLIGLGMGIGGLFQPGTTKAFPIVGIVLNGLFLLIYGGMTIVGVLIQM